MRERQRTFSAFLRPPCSVPPTNPPISFTSSRCGFGISLYSAKVSCVRCGVVIFLMNVAQSIVVFFQAVSFRLRPMATDTGPSCLRFKIGSFTAPRSEEHTSELQSRENLVCRLLL